MSWKKKNDLINEDTITCIEYFDNKIKELFKLLQMEDGVFEEHPVIDYFYRIEFQHRGSPHIHALLWLKDAPKLDINDPSSVNNCTKFIDRFITCFHDQDIQNCLRYQFHSHTPTCYRNKKNKCECRFHFPRLPMRYTRILQPLLVNRDDLSSLKKTYQVIRERTIELVHRNEDLEFDAFLEAIQYDEDTYMKAIRSQLSRPTVFLKRRLKEINLNNYNKEILTLHQANMDIQFIVDIYGCLCYVVNYTTKNHRGMSKFLSDLLEDLKKKNTSTKQKLKDIVNMFINKSEISSQEIDYHLTGRPLSKFSRVVQYINTSPAEERVQLLKSKKDLETIAFVDPESTDIFTSGYLDYYVDRPDILEKLCLADFVANYNYVKVVDRDVDTEMRTNSILKLKRNGYIRKRQQEKILRFRGYREGIDSYHYHREQVMLFSSWRDEGEVTEDPVEKFKKEIEIIKENRKKYYKCEDFDPIDLVDFIDNDNADGEDGTVENVGSLLHIDDPGEQIINIDKDMSIQENYSHETFLPFKLPNIVSYEEFCKNIVSLNEKQYRYLMNFMNILKKDKDIQMLHSISGCAGVGKTKLITVLTECVRRHFNNQCGYDPNDICILLTAYTGRAAHLTHGMTLHSALKLPLTQSTGKLSTSVSNTLACLYKHLKVFIIDEISLVGQSKTMKHVENRLEQIFNTKKKYGGIHVIVFGDFNQLSPVADKWIFDSSSPEGFALWNDFKMYELTEIMRQKNDKMFALALRNFANGTLTSADIALLKSRETSTLRKKNVTWPPNAIHLFATNEEVIHYNKFILNKMNTFHCSCKAIDVSNAKSLITKKYYLEQALKVPAIRLKGLSPEIPLHIAAKYMLLRNLDTSQGLCNGAIGILRKIIWGTTGKGEKVPVKLCIEFEDSTIGQERRKKDEAYMIANNIDSRFTIISRQEDVIYSNKSSSIYVIRSQFPMLPAEAITVHKAQGSTYLCVDIHPSKRMTSRHWYVSLSRATTLEGIFIDGIFAPDLLQMKTADAAKEELVRMRSECQLKLQLAFPEDFKMGDSLLFLFQNIRSLNKNYKMVLEEQTYKIIDILMFLETWSLSSDTYNFPGYSCLHRCDCQRSRKPFGSMLLVKKEKLNDVTFLFNEVCTGFTSSNNPYFVDIVVYSVKKKAFAFLHRSPSFPIQKFFNMLNVVFLKLENLEYLSVTVVGDFNVDLIRPTSHSTGLLHFMDAHGYHLCQEETSTTHQGTMIDLSFSTTSSMTCQVFETLISDHKPLWWIL